MATEKKRTDAGGLSEEAREFLIEGWRDGTLSDEDMDLLDPEGEIDEDDLDE